MDSLLKNSKFLKVLEVERMWDTCAVELRVNLPKSVAAEVERVQRNDPEMLSRMLYYAMTRRTIFDHLATRTHDALASRTKELR